MPQTTRKPPRRARPRTLPDRSLIELAEALATNVHDDDPHGWLRLPWNNGWHAVELAREIAELTDRHAGFRDPMRLLCSQRVVTSEVYDEAGRLAALAYGTGPAYYVALRCLQMLIANSDGGGHVYNAWLLPVLLRLTDEELGPTSVAVRTWRCHDAIGTGPNLRGNLHDPLRRAFVTAWTRGLYQAAYSLPKVKP